MPQTIRIISKNMHIMYEKYLILSFIDFKIHCKIYRNNILIAILEQ
jgi:hypothetical protein